MAAKGLEGVVVAQSRLTLAASPQQFDLIVLDAFSSDAIPIHLMTREALALYLRVGGDMLDDPTGLALLVMAGFCLAKLGAMLILVLTLRMPVRLGGAYGVVAGLLVTGVGFTGLVVIRHDLVGVGLHALIGAGPVLAAIVIAGATGTIGLNTVALTLSFAVGAALPLLFFALAGLNTTADAFGGAGLGALAGMLLLLFGFEPFDFTTSSAGDAEKMPSTRCCQIRLPVAASIAD